MKKLKVLISRSKALFATETVSEFEAYFSEIPNKDDYIFIENMVLRVKYRIFDYGGGEVEVVCKKV